MRATGEGGEDEFDLDTLRAAQRGDRAAQGALVVRYQRRVFHLLSRLLGSSGRGGGPEVADLAQETFLRALRALPGFQPQGPARLSTWLLTIATRLALDELRKRPPPPAPPGALLHLAHPQPDEAHRSLLLQAVSRAAQGLSADHRAAFLLREAHGLSYEEIGAALGLDTGTVKSRIARAKEALRAALEDPHERAL
jgi:RNA polymerase sigma-70 factor (ECF subfamily)